MTKRAYNFSPGPAVLPEEVVLKAKDDIYSYRETGVGVMELSHRSEAFEQIIRSAESRLRSIADIGDDFGVLFVQGGASLQFSMVPTNLAKAADTADYIITGIWSQKAVEEAEKHCAAHIAASSEKDGFVSIPKKTTLSGNPAYLHFTSNNTVIGTQFHEEPNPGDAPLVCDASSDFLCRPLNIAKYGLIYAGAQKNIGTAGVTVVIIRKELLERSKKSLPLMLNYNTYEKTGSLYNTPPTFSIYILNEYLGWIESQGGVAKIYQRNKEKAKVIYDSLDERSDLFEPVAAREDRSLMNITFRLKDSSLEDEFQKGAEARKLLYLKGHRKVGGFRASIYNASTLEGCKELADFILAFKS